jgi:hypothetical protein
MTHLDADPGTTASQRVSAAKQGTVVSSVRQAVSTRCNCMQPSASGRHQAVVVAVEDKLAIELGQVGNARRVDLRLPGFGES